MRMSRRSWVMVGLLGLSVGVGFAQQAATSAKPEDTEIWGPEPKVVTPGAVVGAAPSDAVVLFDGKDLGQWVSAQDGGPANWTVHDGVMTVRKGAGAGNIQTVEKFHNYPAASGVADSRDDYGDEPGAGEQWGVLGVDGARGRGV